MELVKTGQLLSRELDIIRKECKVHQYLKKSVPAGVYTPNKGSNTNVDVRSGKVYFPSVRESPKTRQILQSLFLESFYYLDINLTDISSIQYTYYGTGNKFIWHRDPIEVQGIDEVRIYTMSLNISEEDSYTGGKLLVRHNKETIELSKTPGSFILFPAFLSHKAGEVESGEREAIVMWLQSSKQDLSKLRDLYKKHYTLV